MSKYAPHKQSNNHPRATSSTVCQKCLQRGHFIYECKSSSRPYVSRPSRTQQLEHPSRLAIAKAEGRPSVDVPAEFLGKSGTANKILEGIEKKRKDEEGKDKDGREKKKARRGSHSSSSSSSDSGSDSDSSSDSDSDSSSSRSSSRSRTRRVPRKRSSTPPRPHRSISP